ncbi:MULTISPECIES: protease complex subunit PrcB family protein [unclassified Micromonospora]|uniref:protease complex subunit PrcB family protein n=1 Tax=unclassified Micromonospora TaxID=2617518 RepID=UPI001C23DB30|nr:MULTISPECIES: protease complex subunit PrcB family protein [unclassified Micromonospora]MBU8857672.1 protease complex subunit PrcB family protein [Micromonospora sp. WMMB482]MDM4783299.1 protease complex subunit PrcB family protein [Micromonospora sp. b486]
MPNGLTEPVPFRTLLHTVSYSEHQPQHPIGLLAVDNEEEWVATWNTPSIVRTEVRWGQELVLVAALGERPSSGFEVTINQVDLCGTELRVHVQECQPGGAVLDIITCPIHAVVVPHLDVVESMTLIQHVFTSSD